MIVVLLSVVDEKEKVFDLNFYEIVLIEEVF